MNNMLAREPQLCHVKQQYKIAHDKILELTCHRVLRDIRARPSGRWPILYFVSPYLISNECFVLQQSDHESNRENPAEPPEEN